MINDHSKQIGLNITPHDFRHFYVSRAIEVGMTVKEVAELAGHSNINITMLYTNSSRKELKDKQNCM